MKTLNPYLVFNGNCEEAFNFYAVCLEGKIEMIARFSDNPQNNIPKAHENKVMHASLSFSKGILMGSDHVEGAGFATEATMRSNVHLCLNFDNDAEIETTFAKLKEGGEVTMELKDQFWGSKFGMLTDKFGMRWMFDCEKAKK